MLNLNAASTRRWTAAVDVVRQTGTADRGIQSIPCRADIRVAALSCILIALLSEFSLLSHHHYILEQLPRGSGQ